MLGQTNKNITRSHLQRELRRNMTDAERALWRSLRHCQLTGFKFRRQHPFGDYILDFVCIEKNLVVEVDGGQHGEQIRWDEERSEHLRLAGYRVLRFWNNEVLHERESVLERIWQELQKPWPHPHPDPPLEGEGA